MHSRPRAVAIVGSLAISGALLLAGCGGGSTAAAPSAAAASAASSSVAEPAVAASTGPGVGTEWNLPRPTGVPEDIWAEASVDPATLIPEELAKLCKDLKPPSPNDLEMFVEIAPGSNVQEWTDFYDYAIAYTTPLCENAPAPAAVVYEAAGACDPEAYAYCITPDMDGQTIEIDAANSAFIDIAGVSVACEGTGMASTMAVAGPDDDFSFSSIYAMEMQGVAGDAVCTVTGQADGDAVMTLNVTVLDPA